MKRKTIYIAGPMRGLPNHNREAFNAAARRLAAEGWDAINPADISSVFGVFLLPFNERLLRAVMDAELAAIPHLDAIYLLRGWEWSEGARAELAVALAHGLMVMVEGNENGAEVAQ